MTDVLVSADSHVYEPADLWTTRLPKRLQERAIRLVDHGDYQDAIVPDQTTITSRRFRGPDGEYVGEDIDQRLRHLDADGRRLHGQRGR